MNDYKKDQKAKAITSAIDMTGSCPNCGKEYVSPEHKCEISMSRPAGEMVMCEGADGCKHRNRFGGPCAHASPHTPYHYGCEKSHKTFNHCEHKNFCCVSISSTNTKPADDRMARDSEIQAESYEDWRKRMARDYVTECQEDPQCSRDFGRATDIIDRQTAHIEKLKQGNSDLIVTVYDQTARVTQLEEQIEAKDDRVWQALRRFVTSDSPIWMAVHKALKG